MEITDGFPAQSQHIGKYSVPPVKTQEFYNQTQDNGLK